MNTRKIFAAAALCAFAVAAAHAQGFAPVQPLNLGKSADAVRAEADIAARSGNVYGDVVAEPPVVRPSAFDRASIRAQAVAAAHAPNQNLDRRAFFNSTLPDGAAAQSNANIGR